jgi:4-hydroxyphenylpyruvate dioxygenase-like putative hemolysin
MSTTVVEPQKTTSVADRLKAVQQSETDFLPLQGTDYVEFYVGNAKQAAHYYKTAFGFQSLAYSGPETGNKETARYVIRQNKLTLMLTTPLRPNNPIADHIYKHGDGVKVLALKVEDATSAWNETTTRGGKSYMEPTVLQDENGRVVISGIHTYGDTVHLSSSAAITTASSCRASEMGVALQSAGDRAALRRPLRRQRRMEPDEPVGEILRGRDGLPEHPHVRR